MPAEIWVGTDSGVVQLTRDGGKTWKDVTPSGLPAWGKVASVDASALDAGTAYVAVDAHRRDEFSPRLYRDARLRCDLDGDRVGSARRTVHDGGARGSRAARSPLRRHRLRRRSCRSTTAVTGSRSALNLPTAWVGDLAVHGNDLVAATQGRALWVLDDVTPLRQLVAGDRRRARPSLRAGDGDPRARQREPRHAASARDSDRAQSADRRRDRLRRRLRADRGPMTTRDPGRARLGRARLRERCGPTEKVEARRYFTEHWLRSSEAPETDAGTPSVRLGPAVRARRRRRSTSTRWQAVDDEDTPTEPRGPLAASRAIHGAADGGRKDGPSSRSSSARIRGSPFRSRCVRGEARPSAEASSPRWSSSFETLEAGARWRRAHPSPAPASRAVTRPRGIRLARSRPISRGRTAHSRHDAEPARRGRRTGDGGRRRRP